MIIPTYSITLPKNMNCDRNKVKFAEDALNRILRLCQTEQRDTDFILKIEDLRAIWIYKGEKVA